MKKNWKKHIYSKRKRIAEMKCTPLFGQPNDGGALFIMSKLTREQKIEIYNKSIKGYSLKSLSKEYNVRSDNIQYLIRLIRFHGFKILRDDKNRYYSPKLKKQMIEQVLLQNASVNSTAIQYGLSSSGILSNWIKQYKTQNYVIVEKKRGRPPTMPFMKVIKKYEDMTPEEKVKFLEEKTLYLEAENEYLKKLRAVVQKRKNQQQKKK